MMKSIQHRFLFLSTVLLVMGQLNLGNASLVCADDPKSKLELAYDQSDSRLFQELIPDHRKEITKGHKVRKRI